MASQTIEVAGRDIKVSRLDKEFYPEDHLTKGDLIEHYRLVADAMVPHLAGRRQAAVGRYRLLDRRQRRLPPAEIGQAIR